MANIIDLTIEPVDHLTNLPSELLQHITSYLFASHDPETISNPPPILRQTLQQTHSLLSLASTCVRLRQETTDWALHFLKQHHTLTRYNPPRTRKALTTQSPLPYLLAWTRKHCLFCGKKSTRFAILMNRITCCAACDKSQWRDKITKTGAIEQFGIKEHQLLPAKHYSGMLVKHPGLPKLGYGTYMCANVVTTMFLREDVKRLAELAHGDLREYLARRERERKERAAKKEAKTITVTSAKSAELHSTIGAQILYDRTTLTIDG